MKKQKELPRDEVFALKVPPHSTEIEMAVLGAVLMDPRAFEYVMEHLEVESFYDWKTQLVFKTVLEMSKSGKAIDLLTVTEALRSRPPLMPNQLTDPENQLQEIGGAEFLTACVHSGDAGSMIESYVRIVKDKHTLRKLMAAAAEINQLCCGEEDDVQAVLDAAESSIYKISDSNARAGVGLLSKVLPEVMDEIEKKHLDKNAIIGVPSGFRQLDALTAGFQPGQFCILAARPGQGKTSLALNIISHVGITKRLPVLFFSLEMSEREITYRFLSFLSGVPLQDIRNGMFPRPRMEALTFAAETMADAPIYFDYSSAAMSAVTLRAATRRLASQLRAQGTPLALVVIDYIQLMHSVTLRRNDNRNNEIAEISRALKMMAADLKVPVLGLSQLNRSPEERDGKPRLSDLRESGSLEQDADLVLFIYKDRREHTPEILAKTKLMIAKQRNGPQGEIEFEFKKDLTQFVEVEQL